MRSSFTRLMAGLSIFILSIAACGAVIVIAAIIQAVFSPDLWNF